MERFKAGRHPQSDAEFVARCGFEQGSTKAALAVVVRRVIGDCGSVDSVYIRDGDRWPENLGRLDFWDSIDFLHFVFSVERAIGIPTEYTPRRARSSDQPLRGDFSCQPQRTRSGWEFTSIRSLTPSGVARPGSPDA
jgi:hypothetical protein